MSENQLPSGSIISECNKYRYQLWHIWDEDKPKVLFIMLNPSLSESWENNPTVKRCINFAKTWGYGGIYVGNLYAFRTPYPKELKKAGYPEGKENRSHLLEMGKKCELTICAWGVYSGGTELENTKWIFSLFKKPHYLALSKDGIPRHPLYLKKDLKPILLSV
jgi:hypothetical protein